ncbi:MAG TPA: hypothetical protein VHL80_20130 [Polyangia bacterium]|nr:hypothetical protein [Polyangia bacterium]
MSKSGPAGTAGSAGQASVAGAAGEDGATGAAGAVAGAAGVAGGNGFAGSTGGVGPTGFAGAAGAGGASGSGGPAGQAGASGVANALGPIGTGCGKPVPLDQVVTIPGKSTGYTHFVVMAEGETLVGNIPAKAGPRSFWVRLPVDYDPNHRYRVVYIGQGCGGYEVANTSTLQLFQESLGGTEEAIYVALDIPRDMANQDCFDDQSGPASQEWEAFELFHGVVDSTYCVDNDNVYVAGYSTGGLVANMWGCYFAGDGARPWNGVPGGGPPGAAVVPRKFAPQYHVRAQASVAGGEPSNDPPCNGPLAAIWIHDLMDSRPYTASHDVGLPRVLEMNGCLDADPRTARTAPWHEDVMGPGVCVQYTDCPAAFPVVFCTTTGQGHADQHARAIPGFTLLFDAASAR